MAFSVSHGEDPQELNSGWHSVRPRYLVLRWQRESNLSALARSMFSQYSSTAALATFLVWSLDGLSVSQVTGWGSSYWRKSFLSLQNQDFEERVAVEMTDLAWSANRLSPSRNLQSCRTKRKFSGGAGQRGADSQQESRRHWLGWPGGASRASECESCSGDRAAAPP